MKEILRKDIERVLAAWKQSSALGDFALPTVQVEEPKVATFGEYTSNISLILAASLKKNPVEIAGMLANDLPAKHYTVTVAAPGYLNFTLNEKVLTENIEYILTEQDRYGIPKDVVGKKINNEFISANPTGPLHMGNGRLGYFGDSLTNLLRKVGHTVTNEYYVNDGGEQVVKLGHSVLKDEEAVYGGDYIDTLHERFRGNEKSVKEIGQDAAQIILEEYIQKTVREDMGISFDVWTSERALLESGMVERALKLLAEGEHTYEAEGALWLRTTTFGDDKDRVLKKSDGSYTYFASDAGHILSYIESGVEVILETFGADHHGYTRRFEAVARALGFTGEIHFTLMQLVKLEKDGVAVRMSKRAGNIVGINELIELVGKDVARFFFLLYSPDTHMTFDVGLAEERSQKNPVFYVQYAHARMVSILEKAAEQNFTPRIQKSFTHPKEREVARELYYYPEFLERAAQEYAPHRLAQYALGLADLFHSFYASAQVLDETQKEQSEHRLALVFATKIVLAETLRLLGVSAPKKM